MTESQVSNVPVAHPLPEKPIRPSILHKLDLLLHAHREPGTHRIPVNCPIAGILRVTVEVLCLGLTLSLMIYRIVQTQWCFPEIAGYDYGVLVGFCTVFATMAKSLLLLLGLTKRVRSLFSEIRFTLWKAVVATSFCSHNLPLLLLDSDTCQGSNALFDNQVSALTAVQWFVIGWYTVLITVPALLFTLTKCAPKSFAIQRHSESWFWVCIRIAQGLEALLYLFTLIVMLSLLGKGIGVVYAELATSVMYLMYVIGYVGWQIRTQSRSSESDDASTAAK